MKITELFDRGEFVVTAEVGPPKGIHIEHLLEEAKTKQEESVEKIGINAVFALLEGITTAEAEAELYKFLSGPFEKTPEEIEAMDLDELINSLNNLEEENNLERFFTSAFGMTITG